MTPPMSSCRVVLIRTHYAGNLGSVARAMHNFGATDLVLVSPLVSIDDPDARRLATKGLRILERARVVPTLEAAIADCRLASTTSSLTAGMVRRDMCGPVRQIVPKIAEQLALGRCALVFGPEPTGLTNAEIAMCHGLIQIPTAEANPSLNLSHAVAICLYELHEATARAETPPPDAEAMPSFADLERAFAHLRQGLESIHFLYDTRADHQFAAVRYLLNRAKPSLRELRWLHGMARQMCWIARLREVRWPPTPIEDEIVGPADTDSEAQGISDPRRPR